MMCHKIKIVNKFTYLFYLAQAIEINLMVSFRKEAAQITIDEE